MNAACADPSDTYLMVLAWNASPTARSVALELADRNREQSKSTAPLMVGTNPKERK